MSARRHQTFEGGGGQGLGIFTSVTVDAARGAASRPFETYTGIHVNNVVSESVEKFGNPAVGLWVGVESFEFAHAQYRNVEVFIGAAAQKGNNFGIWCGFADLGENIRVEKQS